MIITVTANPAIDRTLYLDAFVHHGVNRVRDVLDEPSGKGVNVALALHRAGTPVCAVLPIGGESGTELTRLLAATDLPIRTVPVSGSVRTNLSLVEADGSTTKINEPGPTLTSAETEALLAEAEAASKPGDWVAFCGSLPGGFAASALRSAIARHQQSGRLVAVDTSEHALREVLAGRSEELPHLIKPNVHELGSLAHQPLHTLGDVVDAAEQLAGTRGARGPRQPGRRRRRPGRPGRRAARHGAGVPGDQHRGRGRRAARRLPADPLCRPGRA